MAADVVPALNEAIQTSFQTNVMKDRRISQITKRIRDGTATLDDGHEYAARIGEHLSKALKTNLTAETLPDQKLYYNIAKRTITPALQNNYDLTNEVADEIQKIIDKKAKIGLGSTRADFPEERIQGLIDKMTTIDISLDDALKWLGEPIVNNSEAFFDDYVDSNAKFREEAGLKSVLIRTSEPNCCDWCAELAGTYDYGSAPEDIYRRHEFCRCSVTFKSEKKAQNVWTKRTWSDTSENINQRKSAGLRSDQTARDRIEAAESLLSEESVQTTRNKNPAQVEAAVARIRERQAKSKEG